MLKMAFFSRNIIFWMLADLLFMTITLPSINCLNLIFHGCCAAEVTPFLWHHANIKSSIQLVISSMACLRSAFRGSLYSGPFESILRNLLSLAILKIPVKIWQWSWFWIYQKHFKANISWGFSLNEKIDKQIGCVKLYTTVGLTKWYDIPFIGDISSELLSNVCKLVRSTVLLKKLNFQRFPELFFQTVVAGCL